MFFELLSTIKVNIVAKIMQSGYLSAVFHVKHKGCKNEATSKMLRRFNNLICTLNK